MAGADSGFCNWQPGGIFCRRFHIHQRERRLLVYFGAVIALAIFLGEAARAFKGSWGELTEVGVLLPTILVPVVVCLLGSEIAVRILDGSKATVFMSGLGFPSTLYALGGLTVPT